MEKTKNISTLVDLLDNYNVEVPIIQRDYAHGRADQHSEQVINNLLNDMKNSLITGKKLDINFVYGKKTKQVFVPVDGQQRLTTLFLLYIYAYRNDDSKTEFLKKFTYQTRTTSRRFFEKLIENRKNVLNSSKISFEIKDSSWFSASWKYDPTVISILKVLDLIKDKMKDIENFSEKLSHNCPITFKFLDMEKLGMEDDLYIKLNARGRSLTDFENFKAKILERMRKLEFDEKYITKFEIKFDGIWTDYFWKKAKAKVKENKKEKNGTMNNFDKYYYAFFSVLLYNHKLIKSKELWIDTLDFSTINKEIFEIIYYTLDYISSKDVEKEIDEIIENNIFGGIYADNLLFHAINVYFYKSKGEKRDSLKQWIRIIRNIVLNSDIDDEKKFRNSIKSIDNFSENWDNLLKYFADQNIYDYEIGYVKKEKEQIEEEIIKAKIICNDEEFAKEIFKAEENKYFKGQIRSALYLSKKEDGYDKVAFVEYWEKIDKLFNDDSTKYGNLMRRALLSIGDYTMNVSGYKTFCIDRPDDPNHNPTMKELFSSCLNPERYDIYNNKSFKIVVEFLNKLDLNDIEKSMANIISESKIPERDWRYCFIQYPTLLSEIYMNKNNMRIKEQKEIYGFIIVRNVSASGINKSLYLSALCEELTNRKIDDIKYDELRGSDVMHYIYINQYKIRYDSNRFVISKFEDDRDITVFETSEEEKIIEITADFIEKNCI